MKKIVYSLFLVVLSCLTSCEYDNFEAPNINLVGKMVYGEHQIYLRNSQVTFRLYEPGWELSSSTYMDVQVNWDGTFSAGVYGGKTYKLIRQPNNGPWVNPTVNDTIIVDNYDGRVIEMPVTPYYVLDNTKIDCSNKIIKGVCKVTEVTPGMSIEKVGLYVNRNIIVDDVYSKLGYSENKSVLSGDEVRLEVDLNGKEVNSTPESLPSTGYVYARMGLKVSGIDAMIFSEPFKVTF